MLAKSQDKMMNSLLLRCVECAKTYGLDSIRYRCDCGNILEVVHDLKLLKDLDLIQLFDNRWKSREFPYSSGVWRYRELIIPCDNSLIVSRSEGNTSLYDAGKAGAYAGLSNLKLKHEGENPTGSFKDRGMTAGVTAARMYKAAKVGCASTGNTSASMASYAAISSMESIVFIPEGKIAYGKLSQALAYGARTLQIRGDFDDAMQLVQEVCRELGIYLLNSVNPFRIEGQKAICLELLQQLHWEAPDWIIMPGGNLGNSSAVSKALMELNELGLIDKIPRLAIIQAAGANPLYRMWKNNSEFRAVEADTIATAIKIGNPVSWKKALKGLEFTNGVVEQVTDQEIMDAKAVVDASGIGAEPASCSVVAGAKKLAEAGTIDKDDEVVGILTGSLLKDPDSTVSYHTGRLGNIRPAYPNKPVQIEASLEAVKGALK